MRRSFQPTFHLIVTFLCVIITYERYQLILIHDDENIGLNTVFSKGAKLNDNIEHAVFSEGNLDLFNNQNILGNA